MTPAPSDLNSAIKQARRLLGDAEKLGLDDLAARRRKALKLLLRRRLREKGGGLVEVKQQE